MPFNETASPARAVEEAMARVLAAEAAAREQIAQARIEAQHIAERARSDVRALSERTQRRIRRVREAFARGTDAEVAALRAQAAGLAQAPAPVPDEARRIEQAVARVAAGLTGEAS